MSNLIKKWVMEEILPHHPPMILIDRVIEYGEDRITTQVDVNEDTMFFEMGLGVPVWIGIEYMAQTIAAFAGIGARNSGEKVQIGLLIGSRSFRALTSYYKLGETLDVSAIREFQDGRMGVFDCIIETKEELAQARLNVYLTEGKSDFY